MIYNDFKNKMNFYFFLRFFSKDLRINPFIFKMMGFVGKSTNVTTCIFKTQYLKNYCPYEKIINYKNVQNYLKFWKNKILEELLAITHPKYKGICGKKWHYYRKKSYFSSFFQQSKKSSKNAKKANKIRILSCFHNF